MLAEIEACCFRLPIMISLVSTSHYPGDMIQRLTEFGFGRSLHEGKTRMASNLRSLLVAAGILLSAVAPANGDPTKGERLYIEKCKICHSLEPGEIGYGPTLAGIFGRKAGTVAGAKYSEEMIASGIIWDASTLDAFLAQPKKYVRYNRMPFLGIADAKDRKNLIEFLRQQQQ